MDSVKSKALKFVVNTGGYAAKPIASLLKKKGGGLIKPPEGFFVMNEQGPLGDHEIEWATAWGKEIALCINKLHKTTQRENNE
ncbi:MAG: hypothetical protein K9I94_08040 [Bacteroidales bacterium]|nr:hypothetical protein [Bacteroidales bacterium]